LLAGMSDQRLTIHELVDERVETEPPRAIDFRAEQIERILGIEIARERIEALLRPLGFEITATDDSIRATPPYWRRDVEGVADISEEVARMLGYDHIPESLPGQQTQP